ncbi:DUF6257 family protein [Streptomyces sp. NPDC089799]|uniref:DUF6257 family protein n=1 Tax=Streptomyces sp. NPDC089799 TaxID=3155066 RepID=UPI0034239562
MARNDDYDDLRFSDFTTGEKAAIVWNIARMAKRGIASETVHLGDLKRKVERIEKKALKRKEQAAETRRNGK